MIKLLPSSSPEKGLSGDPIGLKIAGACAKFAVEYIGEVQNIPVSSWVYPQNKEAGFYDYTQAKTVLEFFL